ncbi:hypothetical protein L6452_30492 [Arctium lappa]|uniref:Uncharacterized protein n=1 Tax=Arctium lappa TaxID=4217 RepID=A0ACB8ZJH6_ARCLA|nr:hypothetical protein L6452_30492 [Arctium lappa]
MQAPTSYSTGCLSKAFCTEVTTLDTSSSFTELLGLTLFCFFFEIENAKKTPVLKAMLQTFVSLMFLGFEEQHLRFETESAQKVNSEEYL